VASRDPLEVYAYYAATNVFAYTGLPFKDRLQISREAILIASRNGITGKRELLKAASIAQCKEWRRYRSFCGQLQQKHELHPNAVRYWTTSPGPFTDRVIERLAVRQVLDALPPAQRAILINAANGIRPKYASQLQQARQAAWALWHDWEAPQAYLYGSGWNRKSEHLS
jgi:hypothetical protein